MIEKIRSLDYLTPEDVGEVVEALDEVLADYINQSHLPLEDKVLIGAAWKVKSSVEEKCQSCKGSGSILCQPTHQELRYAPCDECEENDLSDLWFEEVELGLNNAWIEHNNRAKQASSPDQRKELEKIRDNVNHKKNAALKSLGVEHIEAWRCGCHRFDCSFCCNW